MLVAAAAAVGCRVFINMYSKYIEYICIYVYVYFVLEFGCHCRYLCSPGIATYLRLRMARSMIWLIRVSE